MPSLLRIIQHYGGVAATHEILAMGVGPRRLTAAVRSGEVIRARQGWYVPASTRDDVVRAIRVGGRLASVSAASTYGLAVPHSYPLHVHVPHRDSRLRSETDARVHLSDSLGATTVIHRGRLSIPTLASRLRVSLLDALAQVVRTENEENSVACLDSALHLGVVAPSAMSSLFRELPRKYRYLESQLDAASDGYPESVTRCLLLRAGIVAQTQVCVLGERWIDLLIGDRLALEIDGAGKYTQDMSPVEVARRMDADRVRDAFLEALGYHVIRLSYRMVVFDWPATLSMILAIIDRGDHLARR
ncbi:MAG: type IV toxin-antitoxin system AbiEi family antitoxin domain-containing protein [Actinomycetota bacterium]